MSARQGRFYSTSVGRQPVREFLDGLTDEDRAAVLEEMSTVRRDGLRAARHLRGDLYEARADGIRQTFRVVFAPEGQYGQVLLALEGFSKKTQKTPPDVLTLVERRLADWRRRGRDRA